MSVPRTGLTRDLPGSQPRAKPATTPKATAKNKKAASAADVAHAFARGDVTLGQALGVAPAQRDVMRQRAYALLGDHRLDLAEPLLLGLVALDPYDAWTLTALGGLKLDKGDVVLAGKLLDRAVAVVPRDVTARALRAEARAKQGQVNEAKSDLALLADADPSLPAMRRARALATALDGAVDGVALPPTKATTPAGSTDVGRKSRAKLR